MDNSFVPTSVLERDLVDTDTCERNANFCSCNSALIDVHISAVCGSRKNKVSPLLCQPRGRFQPEEGRTCESGKPRQETEGEGRLDLGTATVAPPVSLEITL